MYETLVEALRLCAKYGKAEDALANAEQAADAIEELQAGEKKFLRNISALETENENLKRGGRWIPVAETKKLPKDGQPVFIHIPARFRKTVSIPMIAYRDQGTWREQETHKDVYNMTHWMPLPTPPKEKS